MGKSRQKNDAENILFNAFVQQKWKRNESMQYFQNAGKMGQQLFLFC